MNPRRWRQISQLYHSVLEREPVQRCAFLSEACQGDDELRREVESLLAEQNAAGSFPGAPALELAATMLTANTLGVPFKGQRLAHYRILAKVGAGGMGEVYRAHDEQLDRDVAIKVLPADRFDDPTARARLLREARAAAALNHPCICTIYEVGEADSQIYIAMELVEGQTLNARLTEGALPADDVVRHGLQLAEALAHAHERGVAHRDLKSANVMITPEGRAKVLDFGLAKRLSSEEWTDAMTRSQVSLTQPGMLMGTLAYMAPEQLRGQPADARSDIWALGCVLYEMAAGRMPFCGPSALSVMHEIATVNPPAPSTLRPDLAVEFDVVIEHALAKDRDRRYASVVELAEALRVLARPAQPVAPSPAERKPETFVGRAAEMRRLHEVLRVVMEGSGKIIFLTGEPGMGKTALARAFLYHARRDYPELLIGRGTCVEQYGTGEAYLPFMEALTGLLSGAGRERVMATLRRHAPTWCLQFPAMFASTHSLEQLQREAIGATKERMLRELGDALGALTSASPLVLLLEDLHWSDPSSVDLVRHLGARAARQRLLLIGTLRPEDGERGNHPLRNCKRELQAHSFSEEIPLQLLRPEHIASYLDARFVPNEFPPELCSLIHRKTEGHPLFSAALIELLCERGEISFSSACWTVARPLSELGLEVPENVRGMIRRKIEALEDDDRQTLQYASVEGEEFTSTVLAALLGTDELVVEQRLDRLERVHRLIETGDEEELPDGGLATKYRFTHALYQNILYKDLLSRQRVLLHRQIGEQLAQRYGGQTARVATALATHFERGRDFPRAIEYLVQAADVATGRFAGAAAEEHYSHALLLVRKLPVEEQPRTEITLLHKRGSVRLALGRLEAMERDFTGMLDLARAIGDPLAECTALNALTNLFLFLHSRRTDEMGVRAEEALRIAEQIGNAALRAEATVNLALKHSVSGEPAMATALFEAALPIARSAGNDQALLTTLTYRGVGHFFQTEFREAEEMLSEASHLASQRRDGVMLRTALFFLGMTRGSLGRISEALATLNEVLEMAQRNGDNNIRSRALGGMVWIHRELQDFQHTVPRDPETARRNGMVEADANFLINFMHGDSQGDKGEETPAATHEAKAIYDQDPRAGWQFSGVRLQAKAAEYWLSQSDLERSSEYARTLLDNSTRHGPPKYVATAHEILAKIAMARSDLATAEAELAAALEPFRTHPAPLVEWKTYATLGRLYRLKNDPEAARKAFAQAADIVQKIASSVTDDRLQSTFLNAPSVQEIVRGSL